MFLLERIIGVFVYSLLLLIVCNGISVSRPESGKYWLALYAVLLGVLGFFYIPGPNADLTRLIVAYHDLSHLSFKEMLVYCSNNTRPAQIFYFWVLGQSGLDGMLPGMTALLYYSMVFNSFWCYAKAKKVGVVELSWSLALFMSFGVFVEVVSGIRSSLAIAICFWCCTRELTLDISPLLHLPAYIIAILMHPVGTFLVLIRFLTLLFEQSENAIDRVARFVVVGVLVGVLITRGDLYLQAMIDKGTAYASADVYSNNWESALHIVLVLISVWLIARMRKISISTDDKLDRDLFIIQIPVLVVVLAGFFIEYAIYHRFSTYLGMFSSLSLMAVMKHERESGAAWSSGVKYVQIAILFMLFLACVRGNLCNYKFFLLG